MNGWIKVSERLPEKEGRVLTYDENGEYRIIPTNVFVSILPADVTHWQPLPPPPEEP